MKHYKLLAWPDLPTAFHRTAYRRVLHEMSQRYATIAQLTHGSGLSRHDVRGLLDVLASRELLLVRGEDEPESRFDALNPLNWIRRITHATQANA
jgi:hypothetical protein